MKIKLFLTAMFAGLICYNTKSQCNLPNNSFETWTFDTIASNGDTVYYEHPLEWFSIVDGFGISFGGSSFTPAVNKATDNHTGTYAVKMLVKPTNDGDLTTYLNCSDKPGKLTGYFKFNGQSTDSLLISALIIDGDAEDFIFSGKDSSNAAGYGQYIVTSTVGTYTKFDININYKSSYSSTSDTAIVMIVLSNNSSADISAWLDDISFENISSVNEHENPIRFDIYPNPATNKISIDLNELKDQSGEVRIVSSSGQVVYRNNLSQASNQIELDEKGKGLYVVQIICQWGIYTKKLIIE